MANCKIIAHIPRYRGWKNKERSEFKVFQKESLKIASQLGYANDILDKIRAAQTIEEVNKALISGRIRMMEEEDQNKG